MQPVHRTVRRRSAAVAKRRPLNTAIPKAVTPVPTFANNITLSAPVTFPAVALSTYSTPLFSGIDLQVQLQLSVQLVPSPSAAARQQLTIPADAAQALANWIVENPGPAILWGAGLTIGALAIAGWLDDMAQPTRHRRRISS